LIDYGLGILQGFIERSAKCDWVFVFFGWRFLRKKMWLWWEITNG